MIHAYRSLTPRVHATAFVADSAHVFGDVELEEDTSVWFCSVLRGDVHIIRIGRGTKIDNLVQIGHNVVVGRHCIIVAQVGISGSTELEDYGTICDDCGASLTTKVEFDHRIQLWMGGADDRGREMPYITAGALVEGAQGYVEPHLGVARLVVNTPLTALAPATNYEE